jgi:hypothetical protein
VFYIDYQDRNSINEYLWKIGDKRVDRIYDEYTRMGFVVIVNKSNHEGPDLIVISTPKGEVVKVIECTNYAKHTSKGKPEYISKDKLERYFNTLNYFDRIEGIQKELVVSFKENVPSSWYEKFTKAKITVLIMGYKD